jgi:carbamoyltransferase
MGLAPYGEPTFVEEIRELIEIAPDGSFNLDIDHFDFVKGTRMFNEKFEAVMGRPKRPLGDSEMDEHYKNVARSIQEITNECMVKMARSVLERTGQSKLCMAGGVALNCVANGHVLRESGVDELFIHPAAGDAGGAVGAAYLLWNSILNKPRTARMPPPYMGPGYSDDEIREALDAAGAVYRKLPKESLLGEVAGLIDSAHVVGWYQGRMEWGPRALGHRTILGDPRNPEMRDIINMKIKMREGFRPFAPTVLEEHVKEYFVIDCPSPYMLLVADVVEGIELPAVTHVDNSARVQTINREQDELYYDLISEFKRQTSCPVIINTSMNVRGEPIVNTPEDAWLCFMRTHMDAIAIGPYLLLKSDQRKLDLQTAEEAFGLD